MGHTYDASTSEAEAEDCECETSVDDMVRVFLKKEKLGMGRRRTKRKWSLKRGEKTKEEEEVE